MNISLKNINIFNILLIIYSDNVSDLLNIIFFDEYFITFCADER